MEADRNPAIEDVLAATPKEAPLRLQVTDLLLGGLRDVRVGPLTLEQSDVLQRSKRLWKPTVASSTRQSTGREAAAGRRQ